MNLRTRAAAWIAQDPDPLTQAAGQALLEGEDPEALRAHFGGRLAFGTAGMRGPLGPGPQRMNRALVRRVTAGLGDYLLRETPEAAQRGVVIGFDARHGSRDFASDAARVLLDRGLRVWLYDEIVPTPQLAHAVAWLGCAGGIMVTASHNPPADNGYKVYWGNGAQIIAPHDAGISACVDAIEQTPGISDATPEAVPEAALADYLTAVDGLRVYQASTPLRVVYTAMHGVGTALVERVLHRHGYTDLHKVVEQCDPDPDFPTVSFPNPEEPGALDLALSLAESVKADLVLANDPDADRLSVSVPFEGGYRTLTGNQVGVLLADELLRAGEGADRLVATTVVSSTLLRSLAEHYGVGYAETLTGFKWIANAALAHEAEGGRFVMGYEEALGYSIGPVVRDKDGVSAALVFCDLAAACKARGSSVMERLLEIYRRHGVYGSRQRSLVLPGEAGAARIGRIMDGLRGAPPQVVAGARVERVEDYLPGARLPPSNVLAFELEGGARILARPSGTEPKVKFYFEVVVPLEGDLAQAEASAQARIDALCADFLSLAGAEA